MAGDKCWIRNADVVVTMDAERSELAGADILVEDGRIASVAPAVPVTRPGGRRSTPPAAW